jgi:hypothetical protein
MPRPRLESHKLFVRLSKTAARALQVEAERGGLDTRTAVENIITEYLDRTDDCRRPIHLYPMPQPLELQTYNITKELAARLAQIRKDTKIAVQDIARAAITDHLRIP